MTRTYEETTYRDWSLMYCEIGERMWRVAFKEQRGWHYDRNLFVWDGRKIIVLRDETFREYVFQSILKDIEENPDFIKERGEDALVQVEDAMVFFKTITHGYLRGLSDEEFAKLVTLFIKRATEPGPNFLIIMFFPQYVDVFPKYKKQFQEEYEYCCSIRSQVDKKLVPQSDATALVIAEEFLRRKRLPQKYARFVSFHDVLDGATEEKLREREKGFVVYMGKVYPVAIKDFLEEKGWKLKGAQTETDEVQGNGIGNGTMQGVVCVIENKSEMPKMKKGRILVSPMTIPEYMPIITKARAIVTDEGGITCHAAIIAREMNIPAVIGTKIATSVFKDGDRVEVDATEGVVRKI